MGSQPREIESIRLREEALRNEVARLRQLQVTGTPCEVGQVFNGGAIPTTVPAIFYTHPARPAGDQSEGGGASFAVDTSRTRAVAVFGPEVPTAGDYLTAYLIGGRWCANYGLPSGGGTPPVTIPGCPCETSPVTVYLHTNDPTLNNGIFQDATIVYGPTPAPLLPVVFTPSSYLSTTTFRDAVFDADFYYFLTCQLGAYVLTRVYISTPLGSPFRDEIRYSWFIGVDGNTCTPFNLASGSIFEDGDPSQTVTINTTP